MHNFLQCWGRQEPPLLCPAVAASPPPLSAFQSSRCVTTILPEPSIFTNIDRQLLNNATLTASVSVGERQPSPPQVSPQNQQSPPSAPKIAAAIASTIQNQQFPSPLSARTASAPAPTPNSSNHLLAVTVATVAAAQQESIPQQQQNSPTAANIIQQPQSSPAQKGLDSFFVSLANTNPNNNNNGQNSTTIPSPQTANKSNHVTTQMLMENVGPEAIATSIQSNPLATLISANENAVNNVNKQATRTTQQQLAETLQTATTNVIANAVNAVNAVTFMNAAIAVQQQQTQQVAAAAAAAAPLLNTLATLKQQQPTPSILQSIPAQQNNDQIAVNNGNANALNNALQLTAAQSAIRQQQKQRLSNIEQSPQQQLRGPLSPEDIVQAGLPALLRLTVPNIIRPGSSQSKPIPVIAPLAK